MASIARISAGFIGSGNVLTSNSISANSLSNISVDSLKDVDTSTTPASVNNTLLWDGTNWVPGSILVSASENSNIANIVLGLVTPALVSGYANNAGNANYSNVSNIVVRLSNHTTSNLAEGNNLYFTNTRVDARIATTSINALVDVNTTGVTTGQVLEWNGSNWVPNSITAGIATFATSSNFANTANFANTSNLANLVISLSNLSTSNLSEGANLYFTNTRVDARLSTSNINVLADVNTTGANSGDYLRYNGLYWYPSTAVVATTATSANIADAANIVYTLSNFTTANLTENTNLYYTNTRVLSNVSLLSINVLADVDTTGVSSGQVLKWDGSKWAPSNDLSGGAADISNFANTSNLANLVVSLSNQTTSNLAEGTNLYFSNARVLSNIALLSVNALADVDTTGVSSGQVLKWDGSKWAPATDLSGGAADVSNFANTANLANLVLSLNNLSTSNLSEGTNLYYTNARVYSNVISLLNAKANVSDLTTANVTELNNLYYTNARVLSNIALLSVNALADVDTTGVASGQVLAWNGTNWVPNTISAASSTTANFANTSNLANLVVSLSNQTTSNLAEGVNLYYTNARVYSNVISLLNAKANVSDLTTSNVVEGTSLYYTNSRVLSNVSLMSVNVLADVDTTGVSTGQVLKWDGSKWAPSSDLSGGSADTANFANTSNLANLVLSLSNLSTSNLSEGTNLYYTNARVYSNVISLLNVKANVSDLTTANVVENPNYLYFSNARVLAGLVGQDVVVDDLTIQGDLTVNGNVTTFNTATLIVEDKNILIANGASSPAVADGAGITIQGANANITYVFSTDRISFNKALDINGALVLTSASTSTTTIPEGSNLYYSNARVYANIAPLLTTSNIIELNNLYYTNARVYSNVIGLLNAKANVVDLTTSNVAEGSSLYYTNARVYANVSPLLTTANVTEITNLYYTNARVKSYLEVLDGNIIPATDVAYNLGSNSKRWKDLYLSGNTIFLGETLLQSSPNGLSVVSANIFTLIGNSISVDTVVSNSWGKLYSDNVIEGSKLFYSNARVYANIAPLLTTSNIAELNNLYYTNARVYSNVVGPLATKANVVDLTTANVIESASNLYYTNARVHANISPLLTTANISEVGNNLYYTNARARTAVSAGDITIIYDPVAGTIRANTVALGANVTSVNNLQGAVSLSTGEIPEGSNLYYTNARVLSNVTLMSINVLADVDTTGVSSGQVLAWNGSSWVPNTISTSSSDVANFSNTSNLANLVLSLANFTTANLAEGTNLYYTNARVYSNVISLLNAKANVVDLNTNNVLEGLNLYYTNARVVAGLVGQDVVLDDLIVQGNLTVNGNVVSLSVGTLLVEDKLIEIANGASSAAVADGAGISIQGANANITYVFSTDRISFNKNIDINGNILLSNTSSTTNLPEGTNLYYTNARVYSNVISLLNAKANVRDLTTSNVTELTNLYYTNVRVYSNVVSALATYSGNLTAGNVITDVVKGSFSNTTIQAGNYNFIFNDSGNLLVANGISTYSISSNVWNNIYTTNVIEGTNLYYTNARVYSNVISLLNAKANVVDLTTANVVELTNLYYTNARVYSNVISLLNNKANVVDLTTSNVIEGANLYFTNARVRLAISAFDNTIVYDSTNGTIRANTVALGANVLSVNGQTGVVNLSTFDIPENANLYYTNARVYSNVIGLLDAKANVVDLTSANVVELNNLYYTNARVYSNVIGLLDAKANVVDLTTSNVAEGTSLYYTNARVRSTLTSGNGISYDNVTGNITLSPTGVTPLVYGGATKIPVISVDSYGRITSASNVSVAGVSSFTSSGNSFTISTADGNSFVANIQENSVRLGTDTTGAYVSNVIAGLGIVITNQGGETATPTISAAQDIATNASPSFFNLTVSGNLTVVGNTTVITSNTLTINDPLIYLAGNNYSSDAVDIGFVGNYFDGLNQRHAGLFRDASDGGVFKLFANLNPEPSNVIDTANNSFRYANLIVDYLTGTVIGTVSSIGNHTTTSLAEGSNLYYTNARVYSNVIGLLNTKANVIDLTTSNVVELNNLYYTNARVLSNIALLSVNALADVDTTGATAGQVLKWSGSAWIASQDVVGTANVSVNSNIANLVVSLSNHTTSNLAEGTNLYYTNARAILAAIPAVTQLVVTTPVFNYNIDQYSGDNPTIYVNAGETISFDLNQGSSHPFALRISNGGSNYNTGLTHVDDDGTISTGASAQGKYTGELFWKIPYELAGNTYVYQCTNHSSMVGNIVIQKSISLLSTSDVTEGTNLYYTNARVYSAVTGNLVLKSNVSDLTTANVVELTNLYYTNARVYSNVITLLNAKANVVDLTSANVVELNNLYYTNARVYSNVIGLLNTKANVADLTTSNVSEGTNLYYTNARVYSALTGNLALKANVVDLTTANVIELTNLYYTNARVYSNVIGLLNAKANVVDLTTSNVIEGTSLYYTNARVISGVTTANIANLTITGNVRVGNILASQFYWANGDIFTSGGGGGGAVSSVNGLTGAVVLTTANVSESAVSGNLYYTNSRVRSAISVTGAGSYDSSTGVITITGTGTSVSVSKYTFTSTLNQTVFTGADDNGATLTLADPDKAHVFLNGILLTRTSDYTSNVGNVVFTAGVAANNLVTVIDSLVTVGNVASINKYFYTATAGQTVFSGSDTNGRTLNIQSPSDSYVYLNGVLLVPTTDYTIGTTTVTLNDAAVADDILIVVDALVKTTSNIIYSTKARTYAFTRIF